MARPETVKFGKVVVSLAKFGTGTGFGAPCGLTQKSFVRSKSLNDVAVPDCDDPDAPAWSERDVASMSATISGSGVLAKSAIPDWEAALADGDSVACQVEVIYANNDVDVYLGNFHVENFEIGATRGDRAQVSITMQSDGAISYQRET